jgi:hypothetical protein
VSWDLGFLRDGRANEWMREKGPGSVGVSYQGTCGVIHPP